MTRIVRPNTTVTIKSGLYAGVVASVVECWNACERRYLLRFPDGRKMDYRRHEFAVSR